MADGNLPDIETLRKLLAYDPETGALTWLPRSVEMFRDSKHSAAREAARWNARYAWKPAFTSLESSGYRHGNIFNTLYKAHRVAWAIHYGQWPSGQIDHINGVPADNRISNLRDVSHAENMRNQRLPDNNTSGVIGVYWVKRRGKWQANIGRKHLGTFSDFDAAVAARKAAERELGYSHSHGRPE